MGTRTQAAQPQVSLSDAEMLDAAIDLLLRRLPPRWGVEKQENPAGQADLVITSGGGSGQTLVIVELRRHFVPRDIDALTGSLFRRLRDRAGQAPILLIAPYLSQRSRELLINENISFIDLTGNIRLAFDYPGLFVEASGAERAPVQEARRSPHLKGAKLGAVIRVIVDARPPYSGAQIARAAKVNEGYVSRILVTLTDEGLIDRPRNGPITEADWPALLRRRAEALTLFRTIGSHNYVARSGGAALLGQLAQLEDDIPAVITGSFAAARLAPVAPATQLVLYTMNPRNLARQLSLLEVESGADTVLIRPENEIAMTRPKRIDGLWYAAESQVAIDCLSGSGRMPAEGEALIEWMQANEPRWRARSIHDLATGDVR